MRPRLFRAALAILVLGMLAVALRHDLADRAVAQGTARLHDGDVAGAEAAFARAAGLGRRVEPLRYNLGVAYYQQGDYVRARRQFDVALAAAESHLMPSAHFNRGNALYRQAERLSGQDGQAALQLYRQAIADYRRALVLAPGSGDARDNLHLAQARYRALVVGQGRHQPGRQPGMEPPRAVAGSGSPSRQADTPRSAGRDAADASRSPGQSTAQADTQGASMGSGRSAPALSQDEVERLLNDARGRERPMGRLHGDDRPGLSAAPARDW